MTVKSFKELVATMIKYVADNSDITNFNVGGITRTIIEAVAWVVYELYEMLARVFRQAFPDTATGYFLTLHARAVGLSRKSKAYTEGLARFERETAKTSNVTIPKGTLLGTKTDAGGNKYLFTTTDAAVLLSGETYVDVAVEANNAGSAYNLEAGSMLELQTFVSGIDSVTVYENWITVTGCDEESDDDLRYRIYLRWRELSGCTASAYKSWALSVDGVKSCWIEHNQPRGEGTIDVYILGPNGIPSEALIKAVQAFIDSKKPAGTVHILVKSPDELAIDMEMVITPKSGASTTEISEMVDYLTDIMFLIKDEDEDYKVPLLGVGVDLVFSRVVTLVQGIEGVYSVDLNAFTVYSFGKARRIEPARNIAVEPREYPVKGALSISFADESIEQ